MILHYGADLVAIHLMILPPHRPEMTIRGLPCDVWPAANSLRVHDDYTTFL